MMADPFVMLAIPHKPKYWWYEVFSLGRRFMLTSVVLAFNRKESFTVYVVLVLAISDTDLVLAHLRPVPDRWRGKAVLVTGASSGIGEAFALALSAEGAYLVLAARDLGRLKAVQQRLASPEQSALVQLDLGAPESMPSRAREILAATPAGRLDGFVNNAGISQRDTVLATSYETELRLMTVNHLGPMALTKALLPSLIESGGCILSMNSSARVAACIHRTRDPAVR